MTALSVARTIARSEREVTDNSSKTELEIARILALGPDAAALVKGAGGGSAPDGPTNIVASTWDPAWASVTYDPNPDDVTLGATRYTAIPTPAIAFINPGWTGGGMISVNANFVQGQEYTFQVEVTYPFGTVLSSAISNPVTPNP